MGKRSTAGRASCGLLVGCVLALGTFGQPREAWALQGGEDPATLPTLLDKRYGVGGRAHLTLSYSGSLVTKFVEGNGVGLGFQYMFNDIFGLEVGGAFYLSDETSIMKEVRANFPPPFPPLSDLFQMQWNAQLSLVIVPFYGKLSIAAEIDPPFDIYLILGGGVAGTKRAEGDSLDPRESTGSIAPAFNAGVGLRIFDIDPWIPILWWTGVGIPVYAILKALEVLPPIDYNGIGLRVEIRDMFYPEPADATECNNGACGGITNHLLINGGLQFTFGSYE